MITNCSKTTDLVIRVLQLQARRWDKLGGGLHVPAASSQSAAIAAPAASTTVTAPVTAPVTLSTLNTDAPPFVPSGEIEFHYQQPVRNAGEN